MRLEETIKMMTNEDYKERFKGEYYQLNIRLNGLKQMLEKWKDGRLEFTPKSTYYLLYMQLHSMEIYRNILIERAEIEDIEL